MASNFKNITVYYSDGSLHDSNVNDLLAEEQNKFQGWMCWVGVQEIQINSSGEVYRGTCQVGGKLGDIFNGFTMPSEPILCTRKKCTCAAEVQLSKALPEHVNKLRVGKL
jgi:hypothetical protein